MLIVMAISHFICIQKPCFGISTNNEVGVNHLPTSVVEESEVIIQSFDSYELKKLDDEDGDPSRVETVTSDDSTTEQPK